MPLRRRTLCPQGVVTPHSAVSRSAPVRITIHRHRCTFAAQPGFNADHERSYSLRAINESVRSGAGRGARLQRMHDAGRAACLGSVTVSHAQHGIIGRTGGWCLSEDGARLVNSSNASSYLLPFGHLLPDTIVVQLLHQLLASGDDFLSVLDFGAGVGQYGHALRAIDTRHRWRGFDGAGNVEEFTNGLVRFADLSIPIWLAPAADIVLCLEVRPRPSEYATRAGGHSKLACAVRGGSNCSLHFARPHLSCHGASDAHMLQRLPAPAMTLRHFPSCVQCLSVDHSLLGHSWPSRAR
jgi:hypothetical protein